MPHIRSVLLSFVQKIGFVAVMAALIVSLGFIIALPLWFLATKNPDLYNILFLSLSGAGILFLVVRKSLRPKSR